MLWGGFLIALGMVLFVWTCRYRRAAYVAAATAPPAEDDIVDDVAMTQDDATDPDIVTYEFGDIYLTLLHTPTTLGCSPETLLHTPTTLGCHHPQIAAVRCAPA